MTDQVSFYYLAGNKPTPSEYDTDVMEMLKEHAQNKDRDMRIRQPDLYAWYIVYYKYI